MFNFQNKTPCCRPCEPTKKLRNRASNGFVTVVLLVSSVLLSACSALSRPSCSEGEQLSVQDMLYFGTASPIGIISPDKWSEFLKLTVTPRFPQGFSVWQGNGQWRSADGTLRHELSYILSLVHPDNDFSEKAVQEIIAQYKSQFRQEAVLRVRFPACLSM
jgi:hypothetical protein